MKEVMIFNDWSSISQLKNFINPDLKVKSSLLIRHCSSEDSCSNSTSEVEGYEITVYQRHNPENIIYRIRVEAECHPGNWSITYEQAVDMLNGLGFTCRYEAPPYQTSLNDNSRKILKSLRGLGYTHIVRYFNEKFGGGSVWAYSADDSEEPYNLNKSADYNYIDWTFLPICHDILITGLLEGRPMEDI